MLKFYLIWISTISSLEAIAPTRASLKRSSWVKMVNREHPVSSEMSRRNIFPAAAALLTPLISWSIDLENIEGSEASELEKLSQQELETKKQLKIEDSLLAKQEAALKADYSAYIKDLKAQEKLETKETKLIKKLASEGTKLDAKQLQKLKEIEGELSAAKALTSAQKSKVAVDEGAVENKKRDDRRANSKLTTLKANEKEAKEAIEEVEILKAEELILKKILH